MCCFSGAVNAVTNTNIFARLTGADAQYLVYEMTVDAPAELAMILPLPVPKNSPEEAVRFLNLEAYPEFFRDLNRAFPVWLTRSFSAGPARVAAPLRVVSVGSFDASFIPSQADFARLDARFRLPDQVWQKLPVYEDYGFAVFQLKPGAMTVHPMAFTFPTKEPDRLFFPTIHIHDARVHRKAKFDHSLYCQTVNDPPRPWRWERSKDSLASFVALKKTQGILDPARACYKLRLQGAYKNQDVWLE